MQWFFVGEILYIVNALLMRLSIGFFILRITGTNKIYIMLIRGTMIVITVLSIADLVCKAGELFHSNLAPKICCK